MPYYTLRTETLGVEQTGIRPVAISIPAGVVLKVSDVLPDAAGFVEAEWEGKSVQIFASDLRERGQLITARSATASTA